MIEQLQASAGSGKTYSLTRRFLGLLLASGKSPAACGAVPSGGFGPESILAITFTNKAATEMKERVIGTLKDLALGQPDTDFPHKQAAAAAWLERVLRHLHLLNIRTIDSLLHMLARLFALELGLPPDFEAALDDEAVFSTLYDLICARLDEGDQGLEALFAELTDALMINEATQGFWLGQKVRGKLLEVFRHQVYGQGAPVRGVEELRQDVVRLMERLTFSAGALETALAAVKAEPLTAFAALLGKVRVQSPWRPLPDADTYAYKPGLEECVKKGSRGLLTPGLEDMYTRFRADWSAARTRVPLLQKAVSLHPFLAFGQLLAKAFEENAGQAGVALLSRLPARMAGILAQGGGVPEAYCRLGVRLHHLLIDEFQDTSISQWEVLSELARECLSKGGSLFYVGDVKQAIYGWRGGEPGLFDLVPTPRGLGGLAECRKDSLPVNWRSDPVIVSFNNRLFGQMENLKACEQLAQAMLHDAPAPAQQALAQAMQQCFAKTVQQLPPAKDPHKGFACVKRLEGDSVDAYHQAEHLAFTELFQKDLLPRLPVGDIAVLTRSNAEATRAAQWLVDMGVPVVTENSLLLGAHPVVRGALAFLALLDYPPDNLAFWNFISCQELFGRAQGLDRQDLADWLTAQSAGPLYLKFKRDFPDAWERFFTPFMHGAPLLTPYDAVQELFAACRVFETCPADEVFLRRFLEIVHKAETNGYGSLSTFLDFWNQHGLDEKIPQPEKAPAVRVLTIHKAKGLEFPAVVAPFSLFPLKVAGQLADVDCEGLRLTVPLSKDAGEAYRQAVAKALLEQLNLLYVAWTRPVGELYAFVPAHAKVVNRYPLQKALELMFEAVGFAASQAEFVLGARPPSQASLLDPGQAAPAAKASPASVRTAEAFAPLDWLPGLRIARSELVDPNERLRFNERKRGIVLHKALEKLRATGHTDRDTLLAVSQAASALGYTVDQDALRGLADGLDWLLSLDFFPACLAAGLSEPELLDPDGKRHRPDLLVFSSVETLVIDYKTGRPDPGHHDQLRRYLALAGQLPQGEGRPVRGLLLYVDEKSVRDVLPEAAP